MVKKRILVVDDELNIIKFLRSNLEARDFDVVAAINGAEALNTFEKELPDLVILDIMMPKIDGFEVCRRLREWTQTPIIMLSARADEGDKVKCLDLGADDYLAKPYEPRELVLRINSILRRNTSQSKIVGDFEINESSHEIKIDGLLLDLTKIEYDILHLFLKNIAKPLSRESIANAVAGIEYNSKDRAIDMHISNLRHKLGDDPKDPRYIKSVWGIGYKFIG